MPPVFRSADGSGFSRPLPRLSYEEAEPVSAESPACGAASVVSYLGSCTIFPEIGLLSGLAAPSL